MVKVASPVYMSSLLESTSVVSAGVTRVAARFPEVSVRLKLMSL